MSGTPFITPIISWKKADGTPAAGYKLYTYSAGTSTPKATYTDQGAGTENSNPVVLDSNGEAEVWLNGNYKLVLTTDEDVTLWTVDDVESFLSELQVSDFSRTLLDDTTAGAWFTTLGISAYIQTLLNDADAATARGTLSAAAADGDVLDISWEPTYYTPDAAPAEAADVDDLTAHLYGIDQSIGTIESQLIAATSTNAGLVELATSAEGITGTAEDRAMTPKATADKIDDWWSNNNVKWPTVRQTVFSGAVSAGAPNYLGGVGTATCTIDATPTPVDMTWASGFQDGAPLDYAYRELSDQEVEVYAGAINYLYADYNGGTPTYGKTGFVPRYVMTAPSSGLTDFRAVLATLEGNDLATTYTGVYGESWTFSAANANISTTQKKFGSSSLRFNGTNGYCKIDAPTLSDGRWTIELWMRPDSVGATRYLVSADVTNKLAFHVNASNNMILYLGTGAGSFNIANGTTGTATIAANTWHHIALVFDGAAYKLYVDGTLDITVSSSSSIAQPTYLYIGELGWSLGSTPMIGYVDDFRISPWPRYTANFTPPASQFTAETMFYFNIAEMLMYSGYPGNWTAAEILFLGEADVGPDGLIDTVTPYALRGYYHFRGTTSAASTTKTHGIGVHPAGSLIANLVEAGVQVMDENFTINRTQVTWTAFAGTSEITVQRSW